MSNQMKRKINFYYFTMQYLCDPIVASDERPFKLQKDNLSGMDD